MTEPSTEVLDSPRQRVVTLRMLLLAMIVASLVSVCVAVALSYALIGQPEPGPRGQPGEQGQAGVRGERGGQGPAGDTEVDEEAVWEVVEGDPQRVTDLVEDNLDPTPSDVQTNVESVADDLSSVCSELSLADALSNDVLSCP